MAKLKLYNTILSKLQTLTQRDGNLIVARDSETLYIDVNGERIAISDHVDIPTDLERLAILSPNPLKMYYVKETNTLWKYVDGEWKVIATDGSNKVDKEPGKGLSTNDLTDELKIKYDERVRSVPATDFEEATTPEFIQGIDEYEKELEDLKSSVVKSVNGVQPDAHGNVNVEGGGTPIDPDDSIYKVANQYSEEEQIIGCWIDGKPLYQATEIIYSPTYSKGGIVTTTGEYFYSDNRVHTLELYSGINVKASGNVQIYCYYYDKVTEAYISNYSADWGTEIYLPDTYKYRIILRYSDNSNIGNINEIANKVLFSFKNIDNVDMIFSDKKETNLGNYQIINYTKTTDEPNSFSSDVVLVKRSEIRTMVDDYLNEIAEGGH